MSGVNDLSCEDISISKVSLTEITDEIGGNGGDVSWSTRSRIVNDVELDRISW